MFGWYGSKTRPDGMLEEQLGYRFKDPALLERALVHRSYRFENEGVSHDNQRLEFLGDAVLGFVVAAHLFATLPEEDEGFLTALRSRLTKGKTLSRIARQLDVGTHIRLGKGEERSGGRKRASALEDALESVIGAVYLDGGLKGVQRVFEHVFLPVLNELEGDQWADNPKGKLQELAQGFWKEAPVYKVIRSDGPPHEISYLSRVSLPDGRAAEGRGRSKQESERQAARVMLRDLDKNPLEGDGA